MALAKIPSVTGRAVNVPGNDIDTDRIIPARFMKCVTFDGLGEFLFHDVRKNDDGSDKPHPLNEPRFKGATILLSGANFGCGSSREHAVWALREYGFRVIIAPSFAPIFEGNCVRNGLAPVRLPVETVAALASHVVLDPQAHRLTVDVEQGVVYAEASLQHLFELDGETRAMLLEGLDAIDLTLKHRADIDAFFAADRAARPWIYPDLAAMERSP